MRRSRIDLAQRYRERQDERLARRLLVAPVLPYCETPKSYVSDEQALQVSARSSLSGRPTAVVRDGHPLLDMGH